jgi:hypothetical protein
VAGLPAGVIAASALSVMGVTSPEGGVIRVVTIVAQVVRSDSFLVGWLVQLIVGVVMGALFGGLLAGLGRDPESAPGWGVIYSLAWWIVGWLVVAPVTLGLRPFAPVMTDSLRQIAIAGLVAHLGYGAVLGGMFILLIRRPAIK